MTPTIRPITRDDLPGLKTVLDSCGLFPSELLDELIAPYFLPESTDIWFTATVDQQVIAIGYCAPERMTDGTYNLYAIGVREELQGKGIGRKMMHYIEGLLHSAGHRILLVETSGKPEFELTRAFYDQCGYTRQATIPDFYEEGDAKIVFWKRLN